MLIDDNSVFKFENPLFYLISFVVCLPVPLLLYLENYRGAGGYIVLVGGLYLFNNFRFFAPYILFSTIFLSFGVFFPLRLQVVNVIAYLYLFYFLVNGKSEVFNQYKLPRSIKITSGFLIAAVFLSSIRSPHISFYSIYFGFLFFTFILSGYLFFRTAKSLSEIKNLLFFFVAATFSNALIAIPQMIISQKIRSTGITGFPYMDFTAIALVILLFGYYFMGEHKPIHNVMLAFIFFMFFATLSRFAWLGFFLALMFGIWLVFKHSFEVKAFISSKLPVLVIMVIFGILVIAVSGVGNVIVGRLTEINFDLFSNVEQEGNISNSLESRIVIWYVAFNAFLENPINGIGYFMFHVASEEYNTLPYLAYEGLVKGLDAHSVFMNFLAETGLMGLIAFYSFMINVLVLSYKAIKMSVTSEQRRISILLSVLTFFFFINSIYSGAYTFGQAAFSLYLFMGLVVINYVLLVNNNNLKTPKS